MSENKTPKPIGVATALCVVAGIAMILVGAVKQIIPILAAGFAVAFGLSFVINVVAAIYTTYGSGSGKSKKSKKNDGGKLILRIIAIFIFAAFIGNGVLFMLGKETAGATGTVIFILVIAATIVIGGIRSKTRGSGVTRDNGDAPREKISGQDGDENEKDSFDLYLEADDRLEAFINGDSDEYLEPEEYEKLIDESLRLYDEYILNSDNYGGDSAGELLYAQKADELIDKYKRIIKKNHPEYEYIDDGGKALIAARLCDALKQVAELKKKKEKFEKSPKNAENSIFESEKSKKPHFSLNSDELKKMQNESSDGKIISRDGESDNRNLHENLVENQIENNTENNKENNTIINDNNNGELKENARTPKRASVGYKGIKRK